jgi:hypothetical protein
MDARRIVIVGRFGRRLLFWCALGATLALGPGAASAQGSPLPGKDPCGGNSHPTPIPNCQNQVQGSITFNAGGQYNIAFNCDFETGGHPYFYINDNGWAVAVDPVTAETCFQATESGPENDEGTTNYLQGSFTNLCNHDSDLIVTLACSDTPQPPSD